MTKIQIALTILFLTLFSNVRCHPEQVIEIFRHGARAPFFNFNESYWTGKEGQLTEVGTAQHHIGGYRLMEEFPHLKNIFSNPEKLHLESTNTNRTIQSLKSHLWGMYMAQNLSSKSLNLQHPEFYKNYLAEGWVKIFENEINPKEEIEKILPKMIQLNFKNQDYSLWPPIEFCKYLYDMIPISFKEENWSKMMTTFLKVQSALNLAIELDPHKGYYLIYDFINSNLYEGRELAFTLTDELWDDIERLGIYMGLMFGSEYQRRIVSAPLLRKIHKFIDSKAKGESPLELVLLSAHDMTIVNFLHGMDILSEDCLDFDFEKEKCPFPKFASSLIIELNKVGEDYEIVVKLNWETLAKMSLEEFYKRTDISSRMSFDEVHYVCNESRPSQDIFMVKSTL